MNRNLHRLVFNRWRGMLVAVHEGAAGVGGRARGAAAGMTSAFGLALWLQAAVAQTLPVTPGAQAPAGQRPIVDAAANGVTVVHIAPPSPAGVSRNGYQDFNVDTRGLILNNSNTSVPTQLGGWISGNPQLGYVPATLIVNEVTGTNPSRLKGTIEVAGRKADVVIANPNGLLCDGCGFLNTGRATLATGLPQYGMQGALNSFDVRQGVLTIGPGGLNAANLERLDLIARGVVVEGEVWAQELQVLAGANQVLYAAPGALPGVNPQAGSGETPRFAVDLKALGGLYAQQVYLLATEKGAGRQLHGPHRGPAGQPAAVGQRRPDAEGQLRRGRPATGQRRRHHLDGRERHRVGHAGRHPCPRRRPAAPAGHDRRGWPGGGGGGRAGAQRQFEPARQHGRHAMAHRG
jgi:filamentous hemagglutinin family protein